jgi:8-oxo-dGTP pyrophosphatase MutT (NUDIX family)
MMIEDTPWPPHLTVAAIVHRNDRFLMVEELSDGQQVLNQPAGHLEPGETIIDALHRETMEETGWQIEPLAICGIYHYTTKSTLYHRLTFVAKALKQVTTKLDPDITACHWLTLAEISEQPQRSPIVVQCIEDYLDGQSAPLSLLKHLGSRN